MSLIYSFYVSLLFFLLYKADYHYLTEVQMTTKRITDFYSRVMNNNALNNFWKLNNIE